MKKKAKLEIPQFFPVTCHTDFVGSGSTFVALRGAKENGIVYIRHAIEKGANTIIVDETEAVPAEVLSYTKHTGTKLLYVKEPRKIFAELSAHMSGYAAHKLKIIGITGTKGKTTSTFLLEHVLRSAGHKTALLSTVKNSIGDVEFTTTLTTQHADYLHNFFALCVEEGVEYVVMEVSAQALSLQRVHGIPLHAAIFTNFSQDHAEFYTTMDEYFAAKCMIVDMVHDPKMMLVNSDDEGGVRVLQKYPTCTSYSLKNIKSDIQGKLVQDTKDGIAFELNEQGAISSYSCSWLMGTYNVYNVFGVVALARALGLISDQIQQALQKPLYVPGRMERYVLPNGACCVIDYAHNPSSFQALLPTLKKLSPHLIVVFGCGGDRDPVKRPIMGTIAAQTADIVILTSDNPRSEEPEDIVAQIIQGIPEPHMKKIICELDREKAIHKAYTLAQADSIIAILGKGPDEYQIVKGIKTFFSERQIIKSLA